MNLFIQIHIVHYFTPDCGTRTYSREFVSMNLFLPNQNKTNRKKINRKVFFASIILSFDNNEANINNIIALKFTSNNYSLSFQNRL